MMTLPKRKKGQSLVEAARAAVTNGYRLGPLTDDELELVIGFLSGDFSHRQVQIAKGYKSATAAVWWTLAKVKQAFAERKIQIV